ncbi:hypothetical protein H7Y21_01535 [Arenimonas sp.]|nr:hypothetical protein [Candidatus Parcubacteria bacterium]
MQTQNNDITFDEYKYKSRSILGQSESPAMIRSLVKHGVVKNEGQAFIFMVMITSLFAGASIFIVYINFFKPLVAPPLTTEQELLFNQEQAQINQSNQEIKN